MRICWCENVWCFDAERFGVLEMTYSRSEIKVVDDRLLLLSSILRKERWSAINVYLKENFTLSKCLFWL